MAKCYMCNKDKAYGNAVSHSHKKTRRTWKVNTRKVQIEEFGRRKTVYICTRCWRSLNKSKNENA